MFQIQAIKIKPRFCQFSEFPHISDFGMGNYCIKNSDHANRSKTLGYGHCLWWPKYGKEHPKKKPNLRLSPNYASFVNKTRKCKINVFYSLGLKLDFTKCFLD